MGFLNWRHKTKQKWMCLLVNIVKDVINYVQR
jgi:hypothetical protein